MPSNQPGSRVDGRATARSNMYIAALVCWDECSSAAKVRNMSAAGALVEAAAIPPEGTPVRLIRGSLEVAGANSLEIRETERTSLQHTCLG